MSSFEIELAHLCKRLDERWLARPARVGDHDTRGRRRTQRLGAAPAGGRTCAFLGGRSLLIVAPV